MSEWNGKPTYVPSLVLELNAAHAAAGDDRLGDADEGDLYRQAAGEIMALRERLELGYAFNVRGERIPCEADYDGICCRDATIRLLEDAAKERPRVRAAQGPGEVVVTIPGFGAGVFAAVGHISCEIVAALRSGGSSERGAGNEI